MITRLDDLRKALAGGQKLIRTIESGYDSYSLASGKLVDGRCVRRLMELEELVGCEDGLFGDSQTYRAISKPERAA